MEKKTVIFLDYFENLHEMAPFLKRACSTQNGKILIVCSNMDTSPLDKLGFETIYFDKLLSRTDYDSIHKYAFEATPAWHSLLKSADRITEYRGIKFGSVMEERAHRFFSSAAKNVEIVLKIKERFNPDAVVLIGHRDIFKPLCLFINKELRIPAVFMQKAQEENFLKTRLGKLRSLLVAALVGSIDLLARNVIRGKKNNNGIFIDARLYFEFKNMGKDFKRDFFINLYLIENGFRIRMRLLKDEKMPFAPILLNGFWGLPGASGGFGRYWGSLRNDANFKNKFKYREFVIWPVLEEFIKGLIVKDFPVICKNLVYLEGLYKRLQPNVIVMREAVRESEKMIVLTAKNAHIKTLVIQHGLLFKDRLSAYEKSHSDKMAVWGTAAIDWYRESGNDTSGFVITGKPVHDLIYQRMRVAKSEPDAGKKTILCIMNMFKTERHMLHSYFPHDSEYFSLNAILDVASGLPEKQFIIKLHPFDPIEPEAVLLNLKMAQPPNVTFVKNADVLLLIEDSVMVIVSLFSSAALDAVIMNKPLIILNFYKIDDIAPFTEKGVSITVSDPGQLPEAVNKILQDKTINDLFISNRESFVNYYSHKIDGMATDRVKNLIKELANENTTYKSAV